MSIYVAPSVLAVAGCVFVKFQRKTWSAVAACLGFRSIRLHNKTHLTKMDDELRWKTNDTKALKRGGTFPNNELLVRGRIR